jgi:hypothetical protein
MQMTRRDVPPRVQASSPGFVQFGS